MRIRELSESLGISIETVRAWVKADRSITVLYRGGPGGRNRWIQLDKLIGRHGITPLTVYMLGRNRWIKAVTLAAAAGIPRRTIANWCRTRPGFAKRIGRVYYIDFGEFGKDREDVDLLYTRLNIGVSSQQLTQL